MRILMVVPKYPPPIVGGLERQAHELSTALTRRGHEVRVLSNRHDPAHVATTSIDGVVVHRIRSFDRKLARFLVTPFVLARALRKLRRGLELVHIHNASWLGAFVTVLAKASGVPVITKLPGMHSISRIQRHRFPRLRVALLKYSDALVTLTPSSEAEAAGIGYPGTRVLRTTNGISLRPDEPAPTSSSAVRVAFVGRLVPYKGLTDLLHAWAAVCTRVTQRVVLRVIGHGPQAEELRALATALRLGDSLEWYGHREDVAADLADTDVFVLPSNIEGSSNAVLEAMRAGLPIVATRVGGTPGLVGDAGARFLIAPGDRQALAALLVELIEDRPLRLRLGAAMRVRLRAEFDIDRIAAIYEQAYRMILTGRRDQIGILGHR